MSARRNGIGVAGGARIYLSSNSSSLLIKGTNISRNRLSCSSPTCISGGLAVYGANTSSSFDANTSPSQAGALESTSHVSLDNASFANNASLVFGTARLDSVRATNSTTFQFLDLELALQAALEGGSRYTIKCPAAWGESSTNGRYQVELCAMLRRHIQSCGRYLG